MKTKIPPYYLLYLPLAFAFLFEKEPTLSYLVAWAGSFFIFYLSFSGRIKDPYQGIPFSEKVLRPLYLVQLIFAGYMCCTSIFYFVSLHGYEYFTKIPGMEGSRQDLLNVASCQRYYLLGHAAFVNGILLCAKKIGQPKYKVVIKEWPSFFLKFFFFSTIASLIFNGISGFSVLGHSMEAVAFTAATIGFAISIPLRKTSLIFFTGSIYFYSVIQTLTSGFKEPVIVSILILGIFLYPFYKRTILLIFVPLMLLLFTVLPTYVNTFRGQSWSTEKVSSEKAKEEALKKVREDLSGNNLSKTNWDFLTNRISEIGIFTQYRESMLKKNYYGFQILGQSFFALIPRVFWSDKPITEYVAMARVLENGVVDESSNVSAKPQFIVDGFLSGGFIGIWVALFFYGLIAQVLNNKAENLFGGYLLGTAFIYLGIFRFLWRGNCFEFIFNDIFYGFLSMMLIFQLLRSFGIIFPVRSESDENVSSEAIPT